jgi:membrane-associated progesterone receptor component
MYSAVLYGLLLVLPAVFLFRLCHRRTTPAIQPSKVSSNDPPKSIMQAPRTDLPPPKDDPFTVEQLKQYDGSNGPIYVAIKGGRLVLFLLPKNF